MTIRDEAGSLTCRDVIGMLAEYLEATLPPDAVAAFDAHLADCPECTAYVRTYTKTRELTRTAQASEMPAELRSRLRRLLLTGLGAE
jgi:anti-sigma factor (TIGR02949 family)